MNNYEEYYIQDELRQDNSFREKITGMSLLFGGGKSQTELRETWELGVKSGFQKGIDFATSNYNALKLGNQADTPKQAEFYSKLMTLCNEYKIGIKYHPLEGMIFEDLNLRR